MAFKPQFISFDCYGTLINFEMGPTAKRLFEDRIASARMPAFVDSFRAYRLDEVLGEWKPFREVIENSIRRARAWWSFASWIVQEMKSDVIAIDRMYPKLQLAKLAGYVP